MINTVKTSFFLLVALVLSACNDSRKLETIRQVEMQQKYLSLKMS